MAEVRGEEEAAPVTVVADGWVLDPLAAARLLHQLHSAPSAIVGVAARVGALPPGSSYRVHAERQALLPLDAVTPATESRVRGAIVLRPGISHDVSDGMISVDAPAGSLLIDRGAHVHDPSSLPSPLGPATTLSRPPFPWRPVVAFVARETASEVGDWARALVNDLVAHDIEGRLVMTEVPAGPHLTAACTPDDESIAALRPDVLVPIDTAARDATDRWVTRDPSPMIIDLVDDLASGVEAASWRLGSSSGRVRGRVGRQADAESLAQLVQRLCAGPHPLALTAQVDEPPARREWREGIDTLVSVIRPPSRPTAVAARSVAALTGSSDGSSGHVEGLLDHLDAAGHVCDLHNLRNGWPNDLDTADVVVLQSVPAPEARAFVERHRGSGRPIVVDVVPDDPDGVELAVLCGMAISTSQRITVELNDLGVRAHTLPALMTRARDAELRGLRAQEAIPDHAVALRIERWTDVDGLVLQALAKAVNQLLEDDRELELLLVDRERVLPGLAPELSDRVSVLDEPPTALELSRCLAQVWLGADAEFQPLVEASHMGLATVLEAGNPGALASRHPSELMVDRGADSDAWTEAIRPLVSEPGTRIRLCREIVRHSDTLNGASASATVVSRFLGWLDRGEGR